MNCPKCRAECKAGTRFCGDCGASLTRKSSRWKWVTVATIAIVVIAALGGGLWWTTSSRGGATAGGQRIQTDLGKSPAPVQSASQAISTPATASRKDVGTPISEGAAKQSPGAASTPAAVAAKVTATPAKPISGPATPTPIPIPAKPTPTPQQPIYIFTLTNAGGGLYLGSQDSLKNQIRCSFHGGGINCTAADLVTYEPLAGPYRTLAEARAVLCSSITARREFPLGAGLKGQWQGGDTWYGLWNGTVDFDCSKLPATPQPKSS